MKRFLLVGLLALTLAITSGGMISCGGGDGGGGGGGGGGSVAITYGSFTDAKAQTVGATGGTIEITDSSSPLNGLKIEVPAGAADEDISFTISYADVTGTSGLPAEASTASKLIKIETDGSDDWDEFKVFNKLLVVTLPYSEGGTDDEPTMFYAYDESTSTIEAMGAFSHDETNKKITFVTGTFSSFLGIRLRLTVSEMLGTNFTADSGFRPASDGWYITNYGSYLAKGGICFGMVSYAKWYYTHKGTGMYSKYQNSTSEWRDDSTAIELATRAHMAEDSRWDQTFDTVLSSDDTLNNQWTNPSSKLIGLSLIHALYTTSRPQLLAIYEQRGGNRVGGHAIMVYQYTGGKFDVYDPNHPGTAAGTAERQIGYTYGSGFSLPYDSGTDAASSSYHYNVLLHLSLKTAADNNAFLGLYNMAENDFTDSTIFPEVTITACKAWNTTTKVAGDDCTETTNSTGDHMYVTSADSIRLYGTILGGYSQGGSASDAAATRQKRVVNRTLIFVGDRGYYALVDNQLDAGTGKIQWNDGTGVLDGATLPLYQGENDLVILATAKNTFSNWAGYKRDIIKSNASRADMTVTMTWGQGDSDVDLHVLEPTIDSVAGRHIYYANKGTSGGTSPYLDYDNTYGYGPEHYYATDGMKLPNYTGSLTTYLYGTYGVRVHYYADHDSDTETTQPVSGTVSWRYMAYRNATTGTEYWVEGSRSFGLSTADPSGTSNFENTGASWGPIWEVEYPEPDPNDYGANPPDVMLP